MKVSQLKRKSAQCDRKKETESEMHILHNYRARTRLLISMRWMILLPSIVISLLSAGCSRDQYNLGEPDYYKFHLEAGRAMCAKMQECYAPFLRTLRPEYQRQVNMETCLESLQRDLKERISIHTPEMQTLSRACYGQLLQRNCKEFLVGTVFIPACQELTEQTSSEFQKHPALLRKLLSRQEASSSEARTN